MSVITESDNPQVDDIYAEFNSDDGLITAYYETDVYNDRTVDITVDYDVKVLDPERIPGETGVYYITKMRESDVQSLIEQISVLMEDLDEIPSDYYSYTIGNTFDNEQELEQYISLFESVNSLDVDEIRDDTLLSILAEIRQETELSDICLSYECTSAEDPSLFTIYTFRQAVETIPIASSPYLLRSVHSPACYDGTAGSVFVGEIGLSGICDDKLIELVLSSVNIGSVDRSVSIMPLEDCIANTLPYLVSRIEETPLESEMHISVYAAELIYVPFYFNTSTFSVQDGEEGLLIPVWAVYWYRGSVGSSEAFDCVLLDAQTGEII